MRRGSEPRPRCALRRDLEDHGRILPASLHAKADFPDTFAQMLRTKFRRQEPGVRSSRFILPASPNCREQDVQPARHGRHRIFCGPCSFLSPVSWERKRGNIRWRSILDRDDPTTRANLRIASDRELRGRECTSLFPSTLLVSNSFFPMPTISGLPYFQRAYAWHTVAAGRLLADVTTAMAAN